MGIRTYNLLRWLFSQSSRTAIKKRWARAGSWLAPVRVRVFGQFDVGDLMREVEFRIGDRFEILMVHCSSGGLHPAFTGSVPELLDALMDLCSIKTLAMPAFFFGSPLGCHNAVDHYAASPEYDARRAIAQTGVLSELFRRRKGVVRSLHPTHSVCASGPLANALVEGHHLCGTIFGEGTPFGRMARLDTAIVGIGVPYFRCLTQMHAPEDLLGERFPLQMNESRLPMTLIDNRDQKHCFELPVRREGLRRDLGLLRKLLTGEELQEWSFHGVPMFATTARRVTDALIQAALQGQTIYGRAPR